MLIGFRFTFSILCIAHCFSSVLLASFFEEQKKGRMIHDLQTIKYNFEAGYAPADWKKEYANWDIQEACRQAEAQILATPNITTKQFQKIVRRFVQGTRDYHVDVIFHSTEMASLPFVIKGTIGDDRYFFELIDPLRLPPSHYGISVGDELLAFDGRPVDEIVQELIKDYGKFSNPATDKTTAEVRLTSRGGIIGDDVPQGPIFITTKSTKTGKIATWQLHWSYTPEQIESPFDFLHSLNWLIPHSFLFEEEESVRAPFLDLMMANPLHVEHLQTSAGQEGYLGARKSFLPPLGEVVWTTDKKPDKNAEEKTKEEKEIKDEEWPLYAYIYLNEQGEKIGYIRIGNYLGSIPIQKGFEKVLMLMEKVSVKALVIDQLHNQGGSVRHQCKLLSMLTDQPLIMPYHRVKITQKQVEKSYHLLELIKEYSNRLNEDEWENNGNENDKEKNDLNFRGEELSGINFQELLFLKTYSELVLSEWNKGKTLTAPTPILGIDRLNPHPKVRFTKPILMLIDEMDFSGGDFVPAILQDNGRALLFGARTAGAGGYVLTFTFPNLHGIASCSYTASIAERANGEKIENLGVTPDIVYEITSDDLQYRYQDYIKAVNSAVNGLLN